jgi:hypothetical protein
VQRHQVHRRVLVEGVGFGDQGGMVQEILKGFAALGRFRRRVGQFVQVLQARRGIRGLLLLQPDKEPDTWSPAELNTPVVEAGFLRLARWCAGT